MNEGGELGRDLRGQVGQRMLSAALARRPFLALGKEVEGCLGAAWCWRVDRFL